MPSFEVSENRYRRVPNGKIVRVRDNGDTFIKFKEGTPRSERLAEAASTAFATQAEAQFAYGDEIVTITAKITAGGNDPQLTPLPSDTMGDALASAAQYASMFRSPVHFAHNNEQVTVTVTSSNPVQQQPLPLQL